MNFSTEKTATNLLHYFFLNLVISSIQKALKIFLSMTEFISRNLKENNIEVNSVWDISNHINVNFILLICYEFCFVLSPLSEEIVELPKLFYQIKWFMKFYYRLSM